MSMLGQTYGFPVPVGGAGALTDALVRRLESRGGAVRCGRRVERVVVRGGRAVAVRLADGETVPAGRAVLADVSVPALYGELVAPEDLPRQLQSDLERFQWDFATFKVDWALDGPVPWKCEQAAGAGTVHLADGLDELTRFAAQLAMGRVPDRPFSLFGQMTTSDPTRSPEGTESAWAYTHVPHRVVGDAGDDGLTGSWDKDEQERMADRVEAHVERFAPGFRDRIRARRILAPPTLQSLDRNLHGGAINGGTTAMHQQLFFRPAPAPDGPRPRQGPLPGLRMAPTPAAACTARPAPTPPGPRCVRRSRPDWPPPSGCWPTATARDAASPTGAGGRTGAGGPPETAGPGAGRRTTDHRRRRDDERTERTARRRPRPRHLRPEGVSDETVEALGSLSKALETTERARGHLYSFHQLTGTADLELDRAVELLHKAGHPDWAEAVRTQVLGRNVIPGHWTFQIVEAYDDTYYRPFRELEQAAVEELAEGRDHLYEAEMKEARRTAAIRTTPPALTLTRRSPEGTADERPAGRTHRGGHRGRARHRRRPRPRTRRTRHAAGAARPRGRPPAPARR